MTLDRFEEAWRADKSSASVEELTRALRQIEREGRFQTVLQYICAAITLGMTAFIVATFRGGNWNQALLRISIGCANVCALAVLFRRRAQRLQRLHRLFLTVNDGAAAALEDTNEQIKHLKMLAALAYVVIPLLAVAVYQLYLSGKMDAKSVAGFSLLTGAVLLANTIGWGLHYRRALRPRRQRLEAFTTALGESRQP